MAKVFRECTNPGCETYFTVQEFACPYCTCDRWTEVELEGSICDIEEKWGKVRELQRKTGMSKMQALTMVEGR